MKNKRKNILLIAGMLLALLVGILAYSAYTQKQIYQESTANLLSTYGQSAKTFTMFAQRNWNVLSDWNFYLTKILNNDSGLQWNDFVREKETWHYSDFYLFNEQNRFITIEGRSGVADNAKDAFNELFKANFQI